MTDTRRPMPGPGRQIEEIVGRQEHFTFLGRVRMTWRLLRGQPVFAGFAEPLHLFGGAETLAQDGHVIVEVVWDDLGQVSAVRFRGLQLPFVIRKVDAEHHEENRRFGSDLPRISGIAFTDE